MSESEEEPEPLKLDEDVTEWLARKADQYHDGDLEKALNAALRAKMIAEKRPNDRWEAITWDAARRARTE